MGYSISIKEGNLLSEQKATFIVNPSNTKLYLGSGVSMAFKHHCGIGLQEEMNKVLAEISTTLEKGDVVMTSSTHAENFKYALHVAVMDYNQGVRGRDKNPTLETISKGLDNIETYLLWYHQKFNKEAIILVLPLMGCGVGKLDKVQLINLYKLFFTRKLNFDCEVVIYGYGYKDYALLIDILK